MQRERREDRPRRPAAMGVRLLVTVLCVSSLMLWSGCSWVGVVPASHHGDDGRSWTCTKSVAAPVVDTVASALFATLFAMAAVGGLAEFAAYDSTACDGAEGWCFNFDYRGLFVWWAIVGGTAATLYGFSATHGYSETAECRRTRGSEQASDAAGTPQNAPVHNADAGRTNYISACSASTNP
jgi:hypothetical protein